MSARAVALGTLALAVAQSAQAADEPSCRPADLAALAAWGGVWASESVDADAQGLSGRSGGVPNYNLLGLSAPWNAEGAARMRAAMRIATNPEHKANAWGFPMMMDSFSELKFVISPAETAIVNQYREVRSVYTDGRGHLPEDERWATNWGDSVGCWEGDTLVIDTVSVRFDPSLNAAAPPLSEEAHFVERLRLAAPDRLENVITITDPATLAEPWVAHIYYKPTGIDRLVLDAFEDRNDTAASALVAPREAFTTSPLPPEFKLSTSELDRLAGRYQPDGEPGVLRFERHGGRLYYHAPPILNLFVGLYATGPLSFEALDGGSFRFTVDAAGKVTGFSGAGLDGTPNSATRLP